MSRFLTTTIRRHPHAITISQTIVSPNTGPRLMLNEDWLNNVISALENDDIIDAFQGNISEAQLNFLTDTYGAMPPPPPAPTLANFKGWVKPHQATYGKKWAAANEARCCAICRDDYTSHVKIVTLPTCKHVFHKKCIKEWLCKHRAVCPLCKIRVGPPPTV